MAVHIHLLDNVAINFHITGKNPPLPPATEAELRQFFTQFDVNKDKQLCKEELKRAFNSLGAVIPGYRARRGLGLADADGDGKVDVINELDHLVRYALRLGYSVKN
ncbi:unnamed protein product [Linum tenue]|uniref:EF-hand domain-containing protein n=1 Tax=Linum tenue TaxID=586396 RepID=A0AAV0RQ56_9ROSI|nr:unnamed protein product [Linum tenue]